MSITWKRSTHHQPVILDLDGTVADFEPAFHHAFQKFFGFPIPAPEKGATLETTVEDRFGEKGYSFIAQCYGESRLFATLPVIGGSAQFVQYLRNLGCTIHVVTKRPAHIYPNIYHDTLHWLSSSGIVVDSVDIVTTKKGMGDKYGTTVKRPLALEDNVHYAFEMAPECQKIFIPRRYYNQQAEIPNNALFYGDFSDLYPEVLKHVAGF
jgi:hypothetical protein